MNNSISNFLSELGLSAEEILIYTTLARKGPLTVLNLAKETNINRTRVYRLLENLKTLGFIEELIDEHRKLSKAADLHILDMLVRKQETKSRYLRDTIAEVSGYFNMAYASNPQTKVLFYKGKEGIAQMVWNTLKTQNEMLGYTYREIEEVIGKSLAVQWQEEWILKGLVFKELYSDNLINSLKNKNLERITRQKKPFFVSHYIPSSVLDISHQLDIYNNIVAYYNWTADEIFGVEIYNKNIADLQKKLFMLAWNLSAEKEQKNVSTQ